MLESMREATFIDRAVNAIESFWKRD